MNFLGAFTFGIKTFLPGLIWLVAIAILEADGSELLGQTPYIWTWWEGTKSNPAALVLAIPACILLGLFSNIVSYMKLNDLLVRNRVKSERSDLFDLYDRLSAHLRQKCWSTLSWNDSDTSTRSAFDLWIDPEFIMVERMGIEKIAYVREQYWYHLEFQLNLSIALGLIFFGATLSSFMKMSVWAAICSTVVMLVALAALTSMLLKAARKNYASHIAKMASLMVALLSSPAGEPEG